MSSIVFMLPASPALSAWQSFDSQSGLGMDVVAFAVQDSSGAMWFGSGDTGGMISRYDGLTWNRIPLGNPVYVIDLQADRHGNVISLVALGGIVWAMRFTPARAEVAYPLFDLFSPTSIASGPDSSVWVGSTEGLFSAQGSAPIPLPAGNAVMAMASGPNNETWVALEQVPDVSRPGPGLGVARFRDGLWTRFTQADGLASDTVTSIFASPGGDTWFSTRAGLSHFDGAAGWKTYTLQDGLPANDLLKVVRDGSGDIWCLALESGKIARFDGLRWRVYGASDGFPPITFRTALGADREGNLWIGNNSAGVLRFDRSLERALSVPDVRNPRFEDRQGNLWFDAIGGSIRFDQNAWTEYPEAEPLQDTSGRIWSGGCGGARLFEGGQWHTEPLSATSVIGCIAGPVEDPSHVLWFAGADSSLFWSFDGTSWRVHRSPEGFSHHTRFGPVLADRAGALWYATVDSGVVRFDPKLESWTRWETYQGAPALAVYELFEDRAGHIWARGYGDISRFDGSGWTKFPFDNITDLAEDATGRIWAVRDGRLVWLDGMTWVWFALNHPLFPETVLPDLGIGPTGDVWAVGGLDAGNRHPVIRVLGDQWSLETSTGSPPTLFMPILGDHAGTIWSGNGGALASYDRDRTAPQTVLLSAPRSPTSERRSLFSFLAGYAESQDVEFRYALDGRDTSDWSARPNAEYTLEDGPHAFEVWARDGHGNVDPTPTRSRFEVDATPPTPILSSPAFGAIVRDTAVVSGGAEDARFHDWRLEVRSTDSTSWTLLASSTTPVPQGTELARFDTRGLSEGEHLLRLAVSDTLGLTGAAQISIIVDNLDPPAEQSSPAVVRRTVGGDVYTTDGKIHLYFPPYALSTDDTVRIDRGTPNPAAVPPAPGLMAVGGPFDVRWGSGKLDTPGVLTLHSLPDSVIQGSPALWDSIDATGWQRVGGTVDAAARRFSIPISNDGRYALFQDRGSVSPGVAIFTLSLLPRVFSPSGGFASHDVAIAFSLGQAAPVTVRVFNRAGRLVREVGAGVPLAAGANLLRWDGRDRSGEQVEDGLYLVTVEALGETRQSTVAVVR